MCNGEVDREKDAPIVSEEPTTSSSCSGKECASVVGGGGQGRRSPLPRPGGGYVPLPRFTSLETVAKPPPPALVNPGAIGRSRDVPELELQFRGDLAWAVPARLEYYEGTRLPVKGWFQSCEDCGRLTGKARQDSRGRSYHLCRDCEQHQRKRLKQQLLAPAPLVSRRQPEQQQQQRQQPPEGVGADAVRRPSATADSFMPIPARRDEDEDAPQPTARDLMRRAPGALGGDDSAATAPSDQAAASLEPARSASPVHEEVGCRIRGSRAKAGLNLWLESSASASVSASASATFTSLDAMAVGDSGELTSKSLAASSGSHTSGWTASPEAVAPPAPEEGLSRAAGGSAGKGGSFLRGMEDLILSEIVEDVELKGGRQKRGDLKGREGKWLPLAWDVGCLWPGR